MPMLKLLRSLVTRQPDAGAPIHTAPGPAPAARVAAAGAPDFDIVANLIDANGLPVLDWDAAHAWVAGIAGEDAQAQAWASCEIAWLQHLGAALGPRYRLAQRGQIVLLSSLDDRVADATISFVDKTLQRIVRVLDGMARSVQAHEQEILIVFDDDETYYRYLAHYYPDAGEFAGSGGVFINAGCAHFATVKADLRAIEPVIAHELTHSSLSHLPIPAWLNEGLAVNTEQRLCPPPPNTFGSRPSPQQMHARHQQFWGRPRSRSSGRASPSCGRTKATSCPMTWRASWSRNSPPTGRGSARSCSRPTWPTAAAQPPRSTWACRSATLQPRCWSSRPMRAGRRTRGCGMATPNAARSSPSHAAIAVNP